MDQLRPGVPAAWINFGGMDEVDDFRHLSPKLATMIHAGVAARQKSNRPTSRAREKNHAE